MDRVRANDFGGLHDIFCICNAYGRLEGLFVARIEDWIISISEVVLSELFSIFRGQTHGGVTTL